MGATHYTHWFFPLTGKYAEKHISFLEYGSKGEYIKKFNGKRIRIQNDFSLHTLALADGHYDFVVERNGQLIELTDVYMEWREAPGEGGQKRFGMTFANEKTTAKSVVTRVLPTAGNYVDQVFVMFRMMFAGQVSFSDLSGPVRIVDQMNQTASQSETTWFAFLNLLVHNCNIRSLTPATTKRLMNHNLGIG